VRQDKQDTLLWFFRTGRIFCLRDGRIFNALTGREFKYSVNNGGYNTTGFRSRRDGKHVAISQHQAIWVYFNGTIPRGLEINHRNGRKSDNRLSNLELVTRTENNKHAFRIGLKPKYWGDRAPKRKLSEADVREIKKLLAAGIPQKNIAAQYGVARNTISSIKIGASWRRTV
jgi:hypothetical protein